MRSTWLWIFNLSLVCTAKSATTRLCDPLTPPAVHAAFYLWYGNTTVDGRWLHWDHGVVPHWTPSVDRKYPKFNWTPPHDPHAPFMPQRGTYSSSSRKTMEEQFEELKRAGVDSAMVSWWGRKDWWGKGDRGASTDELIPGVLEAASKAGVFVSFHIEPYKGRTAKTFLDDLKYIHREYGRHPAIWREGPKKLPLFWLYDVSKEHSGKDVALWKETLDSVRGTYVDGVFLSLWLGVSGELEFVNEVGFDGAYTYFASAGSTQGSTPSTWPRVAKDFAKSNKYFVPSVGPGYNDERIRPWNKQATRSRSEGRYYHEMWENAMNLQIPGAAHAISVTSYNEWGEGTQIEPAVPYTPKGKKPFLDYLPLAADGYLEATRILADKFRSERGKKCYVGKSKLEL